MSSENNVPAQAGDEPMRAAPELTKEVVDLLQWMTGAPDVDGIPQPYAGAIVLLETFASIGMKFASDLRAAAQVSSLATADVERYREGWQDGMQEAQELLSKEIADAARYQWLRDKNPQMLCSIGWSTAGGEFDDPDQVIDAAIATTKPEALQPEPEPESRDDEDWFFSPNDD